MRAKIDFIAKLPSEESRTYHDVEIPGRDEALGKLTRQMLNSARSRVISRDELELFLDWRTIFAASDRLAIATTWIGAYARAHGLSVDTVSAGRLTPRELTAVQYAMDQPAMNEDRIKDEHSCLKHFCPETLAKYARSGQLPDYITFLRPFVGRWSESYGTLNEMAELTRTFVSLSTPRDPVAFANLMAHPDFETTLPANYNEDFYFRLDDTERRAFLSKFGQSQLRPKYLSHVFRDAIYTNRTRDRVNAVEQFVRVMTDQERESCQRQLDTW